MQGIVLFRWSIKKKETMAILLSSAESLISHNWWLIKMIAIVHRLPRIDNNHVSDHFANALTAKTLCDIFVWSEKASFFLWRDKVVNARVLGHTIQNTAAL